MGPQTRSGQATTMPDLGPLPDYITITRQGDTVRVSGEIDLASAPHFAQAVREALNGRPVVLDLTEVDFFDCSGLHALLEFTRRQNPQEPVVLVPSPQVLRIMEITRLDHDPRILISTDGRSG